MFVIYGRRGFGRVESHAGERAQTRFFHIWYMPIVPTQSMWITDGAVGFETRLNKKSVVTAYLRTWAALVAFALLATISVPLMIAGAALAAISIAAWISGGVRDLRRSDFNRLAFGVRCEPALMVPEMRDRLEHELATKWATIANGRTPEDVARYGARSLDDAVVVYGMLRLAAEHAGADRILRGTYDEAPTDGPYRTEANVAKPHAIADEVRAKAATLYTARPVLAPVEAWWTFDLKKLVIGLLLVGVSYALLAQQGANLSPPRRVTANELVVNDTAFVEVQCDRVIKLGNFGDHEAYGCILGEKALPVIAKPTSDTSFVGHIGELERQRWSDDIVSDPDVLPFSMVEASTLESRAFAVGAILYDLAFLGLLVAWVVQWRRRRQVA